jgi:PKD repeat protein
MIKKIFYRRKTLVILLSIIMISNIVSIPSSANTGWNYIIITTTDIVLNSKELDHFINMKEFMGHNVKIITEDDFDSLIGEPPNQRPEKIRQWLINNYLGYGIDYVLFIGDPDPDDPKDPSDHIGDIPMKMTAGLYHAYWDWFEPTDWYYADLKGNWDLDGDGFFGETLPINNPQSPDSTIDNDFFSIRWYGKLRVDIPGQYKFYTYSDDGAKLWIGNGVNPVIDHWDAHPPTYADVTLNMDAGIYDIRLDYREDGNDAQIVLAWTLPGDYYPAHIPGENLYNLTGDLGNLTGFYYNNPDFTDFKFKRNDPFVNFFWGTGDIGTGGPISGGDLAVGRIPVYDNDYEQLDKILRKIIDYETDPGDISWRKSVLLPMEPHSTLIPAYPLGEHIKNNIADPWSFSSYRIYAEDYGVGPEKTPCNYKNVVSEWKNGYGVVDWATHGNWDRAAHVIHLNNISELDDKHPAFTFQASCANGIPEEKNNLGYSLLKHGAIATVSATRGSGHDGLDPTWPLNPALDHNHNFAYYYTEKLITYGQPSGIAILNTKKGFSYFGTNGLRYNLLGDPNCYLLTTFPNQFPVAISSHPYVADEGSSVLFDGSSSYDPEGDTLDFRWDYDNDGTWDTPWSLSSTASHTWCDNRFGHAELQVRDTLGKIDNFIPTVTINNVAPTVNAGLDQTVDEGEIVNFYGYFTDPGCDQWTYEWDFGDGDTNSGSLTPTHAYGDNGIYTVTLTVTDDDGGVGIDISTITVNNVAPTITDMFLNQPNKQFILPYVHNLTFIGNFTDPGWFDMHSGTFDFGDLTAASGNVIEENIEPDATGNISATHIYTDSDNYTVSLTIYDDDGGVDTKSIQVEVTDEFGALQDIDDYIQKLPDRAFKNNPNQRKNVFHIMISSIFKMLEKEKYNSAINKLITNIRNKADGYIDGNLSDDWIIDPVVQQHICMKIDDLTAYLYILQVG